MEERTLDVDLISRTIQTRFPDIAFAYLFGSSKKGRVKEGSDVDIAIYFTGDDLFVRAKLEACLEELSKGIAWDIIELQKAGPILAFEAISGRLLFIQSDAEDCYLDFYTLTCRKYEDRIYWMKKQLEYRGYEVQWGRGD